MIRAAFASVLTAFLAAGPAAADPWALLGAVEYAETETATTWSVEKTFPQALVAAADDFRITGHLSLGVPQAEIRHFMLVEDPASCPFCGSGGYGPALEVEMARPLTDRANGTRITLEGRLELIDDPETYQAYRLIGAREVRGDG